MGGRKDCRKEHLLKEKIKKGGISSLSNVDLIYLINYKIYNNNLYDKVSETLEKNGDSLCSSLIEIDLDMNKESDSFLFNMSLIFELFNRIEEEKSAQKTVLKSTEEYYKFIKAYFNNLEYEEAWVVYLSSVDKVVGKKKISQGGLSMCVVDQRLIFKEAYLVAASKIFIAHNHPGGTKIASPEDIEITRSIARTCQILRFEFLDHLIICDNDFISMKKQMLI